MEGNNQREVQKDGIQRIAHDLACGAEQEVDLGVLLSRGHIAATHNRSHYQDLRNCTTCIRLAADQRTAPHPAQAAKSTTMARWAAESDAALGRVRKRRR